MKRNGPKKKKEDRRQEEKIGVGVEKKLSSYKPKPFVML